MMKDNTPTPPTAKPVETGKFALGKLVVTTRAESALKRAFGNDESAYNLAVGECLGRHAHGDWGKTKDGELNDAAIAHEGDPARMHRVMSAYDVAGIRVWIVTEADRSVTTVMLPSDY